MFVAEICMHLEREPDRFTMSLFLRHLRQAGQILGPAHEAVIARVGQTLRASVLIPEENALDESHDSEGGRLYRAGLEEIGVTRLEVRIIGEAQSGRRADQCASPEAYVVFTDWLNPASPLRCAVCLDQVPLYRVPPTRPRLYGFRRWEDSYHAYAALSDLKHAGERFAMKAIGEVDSILSRDGRALRANFEREIGRPVFYYLRRYVRPTLAAIERAKRCPDCGGPWLLERPWHLFDSKCEPCRLVSTMQPLEG